jgi:hypothetical protein
MTRLSSLVLITFAVLSIATLAGCGGPKYVPVSGVVKLNGQPCANAMVTFQPIATADNSSPGRGSAGKTDAEGRFKLVCDGTIDGALIGKHRVRIMSEPQQTVAANTRGGGSSDETKPAAPVPPMNVIPVEWYGGEGKEFEVPAKGTDQANFDIVTTPKP